MATAGLNLSNFAFHAAVSRLLGPVRYGEVAPIVNLVSILSLPFAALEASATHVVAEKLRTNAPIGIRKLTSNAVLGGFLCAAVWVSVTPIADRILHLPSPIPVGLLALWILPIIPAAVLQGVLLGERRYRAVAACQLFGAGIIRLAAAIALVKIGLGVSGAVAATAVSGVATAGMAAIATRRELILPIRTVRLKTRDAIRSVLGLGGIAVLMVVDSWMARHFLPPAEAGYFNAASTAGRIALFIPGAIAMVAFPRLAQDGGRGPQAWRELKWACAYVLATSISVATVLSIASSSLVNILFGSSFTPATHVLATIAFADAAVAMASLLTYSSLARRSRWSAAGWGGALLTVTFGALFHGSPQTLAFDMLASNLLTLGAFTAATLRQKCQDDLLSRRPC